MNTRPKYKDPRTKEEKQRDKENRQYQREQNKAEKEHKALVRRELKILRYMLKTDVLYHHHNTTDSLKKDILKQIEYLKERDNYKEYHPYVWNYTPSSYMSLCLLGNLWSSTSEFATIYDVPLDGSYIFYVYDSGQRGLGSFDYMKAKRVNVETKVPYVNPGNIIPITAN
jgi:hypothetical protein